MKKSVFDEVNKTVFNLTHACTIKKWNKNMVMSIPRKTWSRHTCMYGPALAPVNICPQCKHGG